MDFAYLENFARGDRKVVREVLALFLQQAVIWSVDLGGEAWRDTVHTMKGSSRGVGAMALGDACEQAELQGEAGLPAVRAVLAEAVAAVELYLARG